jgi:hypothetical protein
MAYCLLLASWPHTPSDSSESSAARVMNKNNNLNPMASLHPLTAWGLYLEGERGVRDCHLTIMMNQMIMSGSGIMYGG